MENVRFNCRRIRASRTPCMLALKYIILCAHHTENYWSRTKAWRASNPLAHLAHPKRKSSFNFFLFAFQRNKIYHFSEQTANGCERTWEIILLHIAGVFGRLDDGWWSCMRGLCASTSFLCFNCMQRVLSLFCSFFFDWLKYSLQSHEQLWQPTRTPNVRQKRSHKIQNIWNSGLKNPLSSSNSLFKLFHHSVRLAECEIRTTVHDGRQCWYSRMLYF